MANGITFIVGNGLDLSLQLETSYLDFYKYVKANNLHPKNKIYEAIANDPETWSDFELKLGKYTIYIESLSEKDKRKASLGFHDELEELTLDLAEYLELQEQTLERFTDDLALTRYGFLDELPSGQKSRIISQLPADIIELNFVTLNYTNTLEKLLPSQNALRVTQSLRLGSVHHIHGDLSENVTLGVSNESQLSSALSGAEKDDLIKPKNIESMNDGRIETFRKLIIQSSVVVLFGTSIGETDRYIWNFLLLWLSENPNGHIIIHKHDSKYNQNVKKVPRRRKLFISEVQDTLLANSDLSEDEKAELRSRILVIHNTKKLFTLE